MFSGDNLNEQVLKSLKIIGKTKTPQDRKCILTFDEMAIRRELQYDAQADLIQGLQDFGKWGRSKEIPSEVMLFCLRGLTAKWKQIICYFVGTPDGNTLLPEMLVFLVKEIHKCGLEVVALCCDQAPFHVQAYTKLMQGSDGLWKDIDSRRVHLMYDYLDLFKSMANVLMANQIHIEELLIDWNFIEKIFLHDENNQTDNFLLLDKLKRNDIFPNGNQELSIEKSLRVFGKEIDLAMKICRRLDLFENVEPTANFFIKMHELLDNLHEGKLYSKPSSIDDLQDSERVFGELEEAREWIGSWCSSPTNKLSPCFEGLHQTLVVIEKLWTEIRGNGNNVLKLSNLSIDCVRDVFKFIQDKSGSEEGPSAREVARSIKKILLKDEARAEYKNSVYIRMNEEERIENEEVQEERELPAFVDTLSREVYLRLKKQLVGLDMNRDDYVDTDDEESIETDEGEYTDTDGDEDTETDDDD